MKHLQNVISVVLVIVILCLCINKISYILRPVDTDEAFDQIETFHNFPENSIEVMIYGSSHAYRGFCTMELYDKYGIGAFNYGWHWQKLSTTKLFVSDSFITQKPKVVLIESGFVDKVLEDTDITAEIYYCRYLTDSKEKEAYFKKCLGNTPSLERRLSYIMPFAMFHENWNNICRDSFKPLNYGGTDKVKRTMGFAESDLVEETDICGYVKEDQVELPETSIEELDELVQMCKSNGASVVFYVIPWIESYKYCDAMEEYCKSNDCVFLDLISNVDEVGLDGKTDFSDVCHLNTNGSIKVADYVGKYLVDNYDLTDMRQYDDNLWEKAKMIVDE